ncbi:thiamine phosphate synthase [Parabacteroides sp. PF5-9]|uniref:thiamine phosphate synthase n=1 Tax=Parabacteroides sp. PF5-9 TaxID=1742404 RepID=UPI002476A2C1|nr:thiamine phosphate synthase [Parabacteroides sp. PF5-9]MDH6357115.1 thiamine-phosphate pyrophosphorylase [Parabacteroides sp. PF5-9]
MQKKIDLSLYLVTDSMLSLGRPLIEVVEEAVKGGVTLVQLREKTCDSKTFYERAVALKRILKPYGVPLIVNDRLDIALASDADGLHIGQNDLPYPIARKLLGKNKIIGLSVENEEDVLRANQLDIDYIGISPVFNTPTKTDTASALGLDGVRSITHLSNHPAVAIGGVNLNNATEIIRAGADGLSVVSAIMSAADPQKAAADFCRIIHQIRLKDVNK